MLSRFIDKKLKVARYKFLEDGSFFGEIPGLRGVWSNAKTKKVCQKELREVLEEWILLKIRDHERIPGLEISFDRRSMFKHV